MAADLDAELVLSCIEGQETAWRALLARHGEAIRSAAEVTLRRAARQRSDSDVDEVCQQVLVSLFADDARRLRSFRGRSSLQTWLRVIAARTALNLVRAQARRDPGRFRTPVQAARSGGEDEDSVLDELPARDRTLLRLYFFQRLSHTEIADALRLSPNSISSLVSRALERARRRLSDWT